MPCSEGTPDSANRLREHIESTQTLNNRPVAQNSIRKIIKRYFRKQDVKLPDLKKLVDLELQSSKTITLNSSFINLVLMAIQYGMALPAIVTEDILSNVFIQRTIIFTNSIEEITK